MAELTSSKNMSANPRRGLASFVSFFDLVVSDYQKYTRTMAIDTQTMMSAPLADLRSSRNFPKRSQNDGPSSERSINVSESDDLIAR